MVDVHVIPPGTQVGVSIYAVDHNEQYFEDQFAFRSERWLEADEVRLAAMRAAFSSSSLGARGCAGKHMAYLEMNLTMAKALWHFDFTAAPGDAAVSGGGGPGFGAGRHRPDELQLHDIFGAVHHGPTLTFRPRSPRVCSSVEHHKFV